MTDEAPVEVKPDEPRKIALVGELAFSGKAVARTLAAHGLVVRVLCPDAQTEATFSALRNAMTGSDLELVRGDLGSADAVAETLRDAHGICFLSPINFSGRMYRAETHLADVRRVIQAAEHLAIRKLVYHSALGAHARACSRALRDAAAAEELIAHGRSQDFRIRTGPLMGCDDGFLSELARAAGSPTLVMSVCGYGGTVVQPLHVDDLARCVTRICSDATDELHPGVYNLSGPETVTLLELLDSFLDLTRRHKLKVHLPLFVLKLLVAVKRDEAFGERVGLLLDGFAAEHNDTLALLGPETTLITPRQAQQEVLAAAGG